MISIWGIFGGEDENNRLLKLWFLKTWKVEVSRVKKILAWNWPIGICLHSVRTCPLSKMDEMNSEYPTSARAFLWSLGFIAFSKVLQMKKYPAKA